MIRGRGLGRIAVIASAAFACALLVLISSGTAFALAPHVGSGTSPDTCAMCHRAHTASGDFGRVDAESWEMTSSALAIAVPLDAGDTALCYVCHGVDALGSGTPVGGSFAQESAHSLAPTESPFGPSVKYCSSCHDSHGAEKASPGVPYPKLLRARTEDGDGVFRQSAYCGTCHEVRAESRFPGVAIYEKTAHFSALPDPESGTLIRCSNCHEEHGSSIAPLVTAEVVPPSTTTAEPVSANDRTFCLICHDEARGTFPGAADYDDTVHGSSDTTVAIPGEWPDEDASRLVGECQVCHAPMGIDDGEGDPIPTLLQADVSTVCLTCHDADGPAEADLASLAYPPASATDLEIVAGFSAETTTAAFGTVAVWGTEPGTAPRDILGPRFYRPEGVSGVSAVGDIDGDGLADVVVSTIDPDAAPGDSGVLTVFIQDPLKGISSYYGPGELAIGPTVADHIAIANVSGGAESELVVLAGDTLYLYRYDSMLDVLVPLDTMSGLGDDVTGMAVGDLDADGKVEIVVTDADAPEIHVLTESIVPDSLSAFISPIPAKAGVRGSSVGDMDEASGIEIAVANADEATDHVTVYNASGTEIDSATLPGIGTARPWATLVADVFPGSSPAGAELSVAANGGSGDSRIYVIERASGGGLGTVDGYTTGTGFGTGSLAAGDIDGDTFAELIVGNGGFWSRDGALATPPSVQVFQHNGDQTAFDASQTLAAGGVERAGNAPTLAVAELGGVGPSRHPVAAVEDSHVSTESAPFARHVECADCHNVHAADDSTAAAPDVYGAILGTWGATAALADAEPVEYEYELCYKCHSGYLNAAGLEGALDIAALTASGNTSAHAVEGPAGVSINALTFVDDGATRNDTSVLYCTDCHSASGSAAVEGPHVSSEAPILRSPYLGVTPGDTNALCYDCHKHSVYFTGVDDTGTADGSFFHDGTAGPLHALHVSDQGFSCASCHDSHGSAVNERLIRPAIDFDRTAGSCTGPCHPLGITYTP